MAIHVVNKINIRVSFLYWQSRFLDVSLHRLICNTIVQPFFDCACNAWYSNTKNIKRFYKLPKVNALDLPKIE